MLASIVKYRLARWPLYVSRYKRRNAAARRSDTNQRSVRAPFHCVKPFITT